MKLDTWIALASLVLVLISLRRGEAGMAPAPAPSEPGPFGEAGPGVEAGEPPIVIY